MPNVTRNPIRWLLALLLFLAGLTLATQAGALDPVLVSSWPDLSNRGIRALAVRDRIAYLGIAGSGDFSPATFGIVDLTDPSHPKLLGLTSTYGGTILSVTVEGELAYLAKGNFGLDIMDISDKSRPVIVGHYGGYVGGSLSVTNNRLYLGAGSQGLRILDVSNPEVPQLVGSATNGTWSVAVLGNRAYATGAVQIPLQVFDISDPTNPRVLSNYSTNQFLGIAMAVDGAYAYLTGFGMAILDVQDIANIKQTAWLTDSRIWYSVKKAGRHVYVANGDFVVVDVGDPKNPQKVGSLPSGSGQAFDVAIDGNYAYLLDGATGLRVIDISDPTHPSVVADLGNTGYVNGVAVQGKYAYVAEKYAGLQILDVSDPSHPASVASYYNGGYDPVLGVGVSGNVGYLLRTNGVVQFIDLSDPLKPQKPGSYKLSTGVSGVLISGHYAFVEGNYPGLDILDIADTANPAFVGRYYVSQACGISLVGKTAYLNTSSAGLVALDISDLSNPVFKNSYRNYGCSQMAVVGTQALLASGVNGLQVLDLLSQNSSRQILTNSTNVNIVGITTTDHYAYVTDANLGLAVLDLRKPAELPVVAGYKALGQPRAATISGSYAYVPNSPAGLSILSLPTEAVAPVIRLIPIERTVAGAFRFQVQAAVGVSGRIERATQLGAWSTWKSITLATNSFELLDTDAASSTRFYRFVTP